MEKENNIINDKEIECYIDYDNKEIWFDQINIAKIYEVSRSYIAKRISILSKTEGTYIPNWNTYSSKNGGICSKMEHMLKNNRTYNIKLYNHNYVIKIGYALSYEKGEMVKDFVNNYFNNSFDDENI